MDPYRIEYDPKTKTCVVHNHSVNVLKLEFKHIESTYSERSIEIGPRRFFSISLSREVDLYISSDYKKVDIYRVGGDEFFLLDYTRDFSYEDPFVFLTGHSGGGTSVVAKVLRYRGVYGGIDSGNIENRKHHESACFNTFLNASTVNKSVEITKEIGDKILGSYKYKKGVPNLVKYPNLGMVSLLTEEIFPNSKFISVIREQNNYFGTNEGRNFNTSDPLSILNIQKFDLEGSPIFHLKFKKFFTDYVYFNKVLKYVGSDNFIESGEEFEQLKQDIKFEPKVLE